MFLKGLLSGKTASSQRQSERRAWPRYRVRQPAALHLDARRIPVTIDNIGRGGVRLRAKTPLFGSRHYTLKIEAPGKSLVFNLTLLWSQPGKKGRTLCGGVFEEPGSQQSTDFREYLTEIQQQPTLSYFRPEGKGEFPCSLHGPGGCPPVEFM